MRLIMLMTSLNALCLTSSSKPKDIQFPLTKDKENQQIFAFHKLEPEKV